MSILSQSEKLLYVLSHPAGLLSRKNYDFWKFWTCPFWKVVHFLKFGHFVKNGSAGQTTMLTRRATKFCVEPRSPFSNISHQESKTIGKPSNIASWPECRLEFPGDSSDSGGRAGVARTLGIWWDPESITHTKHISRARNPTLRLLNDTKYKKTLRLICFFLSLPMPA